MERIEQMISCQLLCDTDISVFKVVTSKSSHLSPLA